MAVFALKAPPRAIGARKRSSPYTRRRKGNAKGRSRRPRKLPKPTRITPAPAGWSGPVPQPTPLPPAPLLRPLEAGVLGLAALLAQFWSLANPPREPGTGEDDGYFDRSEFPEELDIDGTLPAPGFFGSGTFVDIGESTLLGAPDLAPFKCQEQYQGPAKTVIAYDRPRPSIGYAPNPSADCAGAYAIVSIDDDRGPAFPRITTGLAPSPLPRSQMAPSGDWVSGETIVVPPSIRVRPRNTGIPTIPFFRSNTPGPVRPSPVLPQPEEVPQVAPSRTTPLAPPRPLAPPAPVPDAEPLPLPGTTPTPAPGTPPDPLPLSSPVVRPGPSSAPLQTGTPVLPQPDPDVGLTPDGGTETITPPVETPTTPTEQRVINGEPVGGPGQAPRPTPEAMAQELGRLERKGEIMLGGTPPGRDPDLPTLPSLADLLALLELLLELLDRPQEPVVYEVGSPCEFGEDGELLPPYRVPIPPDSGFDAVTMRLDALAELIREHKYQRQPTCKSTTRLEGQEVTVRFVGLSPVTQRRTYKTLTYRDQGSVDLDAHRAHWAGFGFTSGGTQVILKGPWGQPQVWAASAAEGRRVLLHAASIAGIDETHPDAEWIQRESDDDRIGNSYGVQTAELSFGVPWVTARPSPSGFV